MDSIEHYRNGTLIKRTEIDYDKQIVKQYEWDGKALSQVSERALRAEEIGEVGVATVEKSGAEKIHRARQGNKDFLEAGNPTSSQVVTQVKSLTRQMSALLRLQLRDFDEL